MVLSLEKMDKIIEINATRCMPLLSPLKDGRIAKGGHDYDLFYAGDPCSGDSCFIGGNIATNAGGNKAVKYGTTRHQVYAIEVVSPLGEILHLAPVSTK
jgi:glycolate oxidase